MIELTTQMDQLVKQQRWMDAIQFAEQNSELLPTSFNTSWNTGWAYFKLNQHSEAIPHLQRACSIAPASHSHVAYWALGVVWMLTFPVISYNSSVSILLANEPRLFFSVCSQ